VARWATRYSVHRLGNTFVRQLGVLVFAVVSVLGQLAGALVLDLFFPTPGTQVGLLLILGLVVVGAAVVLAGWQRRETG
jgi:Protein of unknown function, DUF606.